ncbi:hypothetical protein [Escherichia coli]|uniref:hypothetical protein n=1 Tax=Escherichia coli TaxID=562 RepID=UPI0018E59790|nr:hypothetical protein [Escherichia coli]
MCRKERVTDSKTVKIIAAAVFIFMVCVFGYSIYSNSYNSYEHLEKDACTGVTSSFKQNGMENECVDADIDKKLSKNEEFYHGYALLDDGSTVEFWSWFLKDGTIKTAVKIQKRITVL